MSYGRKIIETPTNGTTTMETTSVRPPLTPSSPPVTSTILPTSTCRVSPTVNVVMQDLEEDDVSDNAIISDKQFKILNSKMNSILQFLNDNVGKSFVISVEVEYLLKA
ncbi:unnamed protein product [Lactuca saligna]|uniref:Uncharacterized protein n=1 Tax=Lactuca saligna TaxID=75948 RepID=A0AA35ZLD0_LACSI|nr:unnamed protein product [Lactuca saligna]